MLPKVVIYYHYRAVGRSENPGVPAVLNLWHTNKLTIERALIPISADTIYHVVANSNMSCLEGHDGFFRLLMKGIVNPYVL